MRIAAAGERVSRIHLSEFLRQEWCSPIQCSEASLEACSRMRSMDSMTQGKPFEFTGIQQTHGLRPQRIASMGPMQRDDVADDQ